jgi:hypothetical protein
MHELAHLVRVAREDHDQVFPQVLHHLQHRVDRFLAKSVVLALLERVRLVDEQHAASRALHDLAGLDRGLARVFGHQLLPRNLH